MNLYIEVDGKPLIDYRGNLDPQGLAGIFCSMNDDEQAKFFEAVGLEMARWGAHNASMQAYNIGLHMRPGRCECISVAGREFIREVAAAMKEIY